MSHCSENHANKCDVLIQPPIGTVDPSAIASAAALWPGACDGCAIAHEMLDPTLLDLEDQLLKKLWISGDAEGARRPGHHLADLAGVVAIACWDRLQDAYWNFCLHKSAQFAVWVCMRCESRQCNCGARTVQSWLWEKHEDSQCVVQLGHGTVPVAWVQAAGSYKNSPTLHTLLHGTCFTVQTASNRMCRRRYYQ